MSDFSAFVALGFRHIASLDGLDHILFLLALAAVYRWEHWREGILVVTAFTAGHSVTLVLAATGRVALPAAWIEFLIPVTIVATCVDNLAVPAGARRRRHRPVLTGLFGLVHGAGFANYLRGLFMDDIAVPLFGFNVGVELGQLGVLAVIAALLALVDRALVALPVRQRSVAPLRLRAAGASVVIGMVAVTWAAQRVPAP